MKKNSKELLSERNFKEDDKFKIMKMKRTTHRYVKRSFIHSIFFNDIKNISDKFSELVLRCLLLIKIFLTIK